MEAGVQAYGWCVGARERAFAWREELSWPAKAALALGLACVTGALAQLRMHLPNTLVPVTGQVFAVLLCGALLGRGWGALSQIFYVGAGAGGLAWFNGMAGGMGVLRGVTGGFLLGFVPAAAMIGYVTHRWAFTRRPLPLCAVMLIGVGIIYAPGALQYYSVMGLGLRATLAQAVVPFILWDLAKAMLAAALASALLPKAPRAA